MYWKGNHLLQVRLIVKKDLVDCIVKVKEVSIRVKTMDIVVNERNLSIIFVFCPQSEISKEKDQFYNELKTELMARDGECIITKDFNKHVRNSVAGFKGIYSGYSWGQYN